MFKQKNLNLKNSGFHTNTGHKPDYLHRQFYKLAFPAILSSALFVAGCGDDSSSTKDCNSGEIETDNGCICDNSSNYYGNAGSCAKCDGTGKIVKNNTCICDAENGYSASGDSCVKNNDCDGIMYQNSCVNVGDNIDFGNYPQTNKDTKDPIKWRILAIDKSKQAFLLISERILDGKPYHTSRTEITWETCSLRAWLNADFLTNAFSTSDQALILSSHLDNPDSSYGIAGGNATDDKVFLLSYAEAKNNTYFKDEDSRIANPTTFACEQIFAHSSSVNCSSPSSYEWWLRSPGGDSTTASVVKPTNINNVNGLGYYVEEINGVRPAIWLKY